MSTTPGIAPKTLLLAAFGVVYIIWGSTYLAIRFAVETLPPFTMAGLRFLAAGTILVVWTRIRGRSGQRLFTGGRPPSLVDLCC